MVVLGLILEGWVSVLHLGPPSSSFASTVNRRASKRIRADERPAGRDNLSEVQEAKVRIGNELAKVAVTLAKAQIKTERWFQLEQPASSLMLHLPSFKELLADLAVFKAVRCICVDGAPWRKPTAIIANSRHILDLNAACPGCESHICLQGKSPDGRSWMTVASSYWPAFALRILRSWMWAQGQTKSASCAHLAGLRPDQDEDLTDVLEASDFNPSRKRSRETIAARVGAGSQPGRRALPHLIPEGLGPLLHWTLAHQTKHPFLVGPKLTAPLRYTKAHFIKDVDEANAQRAEMLSTIEALAKELRDEEKELISLVDPFIVPVVERRAFCLMRKLPFVPVSLTTHCSLAFLGTPRSGWSCKAPTRSEGS